MAKPVPAEPRVPWPVVLAWYVWGYLTWPWQARQLKREGFIRTGWMRWEHPGCHDPWAEPTVDVKALAPLRVRDDG
jgi:hypothetical protein